MIHGVDVSIFQPHVDWRQLRIDGFQFAYARACEGAYADPSHVQHIAGARAAGIAIGSYGVGHPSQDANYLADFFCTHADVSELRPVLDIETLSNGQVPTNAGPWADAWCERVKATLHVEPIIYASTFYYLEMCKQCPSLGGETGWDVWLAEYHASVDHPPKTPHIAWQWAGNVPLKGQQGLWDRDVVEGESIDALRV